MRDVDISNFVLWPASLSLSVTHAVRPNDAEITVATTVAEGDTGGYAGKAIAANVTPGEEGYHSSENYNENWAIVKQDSCTDLLVLSTLGWPWTMLVDTNNTNINTRLQILGNISRIFPVELK